MIKCTFCGNNFISRRAFSHHLTMKENDKFPTIVERERFLVDVLIGQHEVDRLILLYKNELISAYELSQEKTTDIVKLLQLMGIKRTNSEEKLTERYKQKYKATMTARYGDEITNPSQLDSTKNKKQRKAIENYGSYDNYLSIHRQYMLDGYRAYAKDRERVDQSTKKCEETCSLRYGQKNFGQGEQAKSKAKQTRKTVIAEWDYAERLVRTSKARQAVTQRGGYSSKPEKRVRFALSKLFIEFDTNVHLWDYNYDIVFDNFIIEVQGDMWHANPNKYKASDLIMGKLLASDLWEKDMKKLKVAECNGYVLIAIWECDIIKKNDDELILMVESRLKEAGYVFD